MVAGTSSTLWRKKCGHSADKFLPDEKCTLDKRVWWSSFTLEINLLQTKTNLFFTGPQDISAMKVAEILPFALLQELLEWSEKKVWSMSLLRVSQLGLPSDSQSLQYQDWRLELGRSHWHENQILKGQQLLPIFYSGTEYEAWST